MSDKISKPESTERELLINMLQNKSKAHEALSCFHADILAELKSKISTQRTIIVSLILIYLGSMGIISYYVFK